jgi:hypothetical protein
MPYDKNLSLVVEFLKWEFLNHVWNFFLQYCSQLTFFHEYLRNIHEFSENSWTFMNEFLQILELCFNERSFMTICKNYEYSWYSVQHRIISWVRILVLNFKVGNRIEHGFFAAPPRKWSNASSNEGVFVASIENTPLFDRVFARVHYCFLGGAIFLHEEFGLNLSYYTGQNLNFKYIVPSIPKMQTKYFNKFMKK